MKDITLFCTYEHHFPHLYSIMEIKNFQKDDLTEKNIDFKGIHHLTGMGSWIWTQNFHFKPGFITL